MKNVRTSTVIVMKNLAEFGQPWFRVSDDARYALQFRQHHTDPGR